MGSTSPFTLKWGIMATGGIADSKSDLTSHSG